MNGSVAKGRLVFLSDEGQTEEQGFSWFIGTAERESVRLGKPLKFNYTASEKVWASPNLLESSTSTPLRIPTGNQPVWLIPFPTLEEVG